MYLSKGVNNPQEGEICQEIDSQSKSLNGNAAQIGAEQDVRTADLVAGGQLVCSQEICGLTPEQSDTESICLIIYAILMGASWVFIFLMIFFSSWDIIRGMRYITTPSPVEVYPSSAAAIPDNVTDEVAMYIEWFNARDILYKDLEPCAICGKIHVLATAEQFQDILSIHKLNDLNKGNVAGRPKHND